VSTIFILGGGGFLGDEIERHFRKLGWRTVSIGRRARGSMAQLRYEWHLPHQGFGDLLAAEKPQLCVNTAGTASVLNSLAEPLLDFNASAGLNFEILDNLRRCAPSTAYIYFSSAAVYGDPRTLPVNEDADIAPVSPYGWHRRMAELAVAEFARHFGTRAASLRIFSAYGPGLRRQVIWDLAKRAIGDADRQLLVQGSPEDSRDFIYGRDVARALQIVFERGDLSGECYNAAAGVETPIGDLAALILRLLGHSRQIKFSGDRRPGNPSRWHADIGKLRSLGYSPSTALDDGVSQVVKEAIRTLGEETTGEKTLG
jgi:UDP-glucose 4-epimerase